MATTTLLRTNQGRLLAAVLCCGLAPAQSSLSVTSKIVASANDFLTSLDEGQRAKVLFEFNDAAQRMKWSNLPTTMVPRAGLKMGDLSGPQRKAANYKVADLVLGPGHDGKTIQPEGIKCSAMNASQRAMLLELVDEWTGIVHEQAAAARMAEIKANLPETWFAWSGPTTNGMPAYYRIQGPTLVIEYAPQPLGGDPTMHIHTIYRDPTNDYGKKSVGQLR
jgi:uncharacterized protein DUF3500